MIVPDPAVTTSEYRYGFNGKEKDNEIKGGDGKSYDFGARMYDPRIGRWFKSDPLEMKYPEWSPYLHSANNPIYYTDPNGEEPVPVTSKEFIKFAQKLGIYGNKRIGEFYERLVMGSLAANVTIVHNTSINFPSDARTRMNIESGGLPASVRPDGINLARKGLSLPPSLRPQDAQIFLSPHFYEAKATSATITKNFRKGQITGMVDAVADLKKSKNERATLTLVTTSDTKISDDIKKYAAQRNVYLQQSIAAIDDETGEFVISDPEWINIHEMNDVTKEPDGAGTILTKLLEMFIDGPDPYSTYNKVNPKNHTSGLSLKDPDPSDPSDPDPAEVNIDDK